MAVNHNCICNMRHVSAFIESHHQAFNNTQSKDITDVLKRLMVAVRVALFHTFICYKYGCDVMPSSLHHNGLSHKNISPPFYLRKRRDQMPIHFRFG